MKNIYLTLIVLSTFFYGCSDAGKTARFAPVKNSPKSNTIKAVTLEKVELEYVESSYIGELFIKNNTIGFVDKRFCWVFFFDKAGKLISQELGQGGGPKELNTGVIDGYACLNNGSYFFVGSGNDCHIADAQFQRQKVFVINKTLDGTPMGYEHPQIYTLCYPNLIMKNYGEYLYYTVYIDHPKYNVIAAPKDCFESSHLISKLNLSTGKVEQMLGHYPDVYTKDQSLKQLSFVNFDIDSKGTFYVSYEGDSLIYTFDKSYAPVSTFGYKGREMVDKPVVFSTPESFGKGYEQNRKERGVYSGITYIEEIGTLFRTYQKGADSGGGLQIYKESVLVGDIDTPNGFKVIGYIAPYYYASCGIDEDAEKIVVYKFKM